LSPVNRAVDEIKLRFEPINALFLVHQNRVRQTERGVVIFNFSLRDRTRFSPPPQREKNRDENRRTQSNPGQYICPTIANQC
jgi:hypothetical protein